MDKKKKIKLQGWAVALIGGIYLLIISIYFYYGLSASEPVWYNFEQGAIESYQPNWLLIFLPNTIVYILCVLLVYWYTLKRLEKLKK